MCEDVSPFPHPPLVGCPVCFLSESAATLCTWRPSPHLESENVTRHGDSSLHHFTTIHQHTDTVSRLQTHSLPHGNKASYSKTWSLDYLNIFTMPVPEDLMFIFKMVQLQFIFKNMDEGWP